MTYLQSGSTFSPLPYKVSAFVSISPPNLLLSPPLNLPIQKRGNIMDADWDLLAVVRGARSSTATPTSTSTSGGFQVPDPQPNLSPPPNPPAANYGGGCENLQDLYKPFVPILDRPISAAPPNFGHGGFITEQLKLLQGKPQQQILFQQPQKVEDSHQLLFGSRAASSASIINPLCAPTTTTTSTPPTTTSLTPQRPKKRKNLQKKVCHVPVEGLSSDMWAWRKYGQKPIKGSPYPRGYYRCSSSKGCPARKQVERNKSTPKMFIVTYTSEHNHPMPTHRNSLAGSTRNKPSGNAASAAAGPGSEHPPSLSPTVSPSADKGGEIKPERDNEAEEEETDKDDSGNEMEFFPDMVLDDDFFVGFEELDDTTDGGDVISMYDQIQATPQLMAGVDFLGEQDWDLGLLHSTSTSSS